MNLSRVLTTVATCAAMGCGDGPMSSTRPVDAEALYGSWIWVYSCCGIDGVPRTPASTGSSMLAVFDRTNMMYVYRDDVLISSGAFTVVREAWHEAPTLVVDGNALGEVRIREDTLEIIPRDCADCTTDRFVRQSLEFDRRRKP